MTNESKKYQEQHTDGHENKIAMPFRLCLVLLLIAISALVLHFATPSVDPESIKRQSVFLNEQLDNYQQHILDSEFTHTSQTIEQQVDEAFEEVYRGIEIVLDGHYTIRGQYAEILSDHFKSEIQEIMLDGLDDRLESADSAVRSVYQEEIEQKTRAFVRQNNPGLFTERKESFSMQCLTLWWKMPKKGSKHLKPL